MNRFVTPLALGLVLSLAACSNESTEAEQKTIAPVYDSNTAFILVGQEMPAGEQDYYLFDFDQGLATSENTEELLQTLRRNPLDSKYLGLIGPDAEKNLQVVRALAESVQTSYPEVRFVYVGPAQHEQDVRQALAPLEMRLRYVVYP